MVRVGIVGCGKISDSHAQQILRIAGSEIVGACDRELLMAQQFAERFGVSYATDDLDELLARAKPDVIHITTPPKSHLSIAMRCLQRGAHVYVEKPFTLNTREAEQLLGLAEQEGRLVTVGHDDQFRHAARRMRQLVNRGYLGGAPVHMESYYCYELGEGSYARALLGDPNHWVRQLPGKLLHNIISHGIARIAEFVQSDRPTVFAHGFVSPLLRSKGEREIVDELRVIIDDQGERTAFFTFSSQMRPSLHQFRLYGSKNGLLLDQDNETLIRLDGLRKKSYLEQLLPPVILSGQYCRNALTNLGAILRCDFHPKSGLKWLVEAFYRSIAQGHPLPISYREILRTSTIMDSVFAQIYPDCGASHEAIVSTTPTSS